jgi:hypothetical protein
MIRLAARGGLKALTSGSTSDRPGEEEVAMPPRSSPPRPRATGDLAPELTSRIREGVTRSVRKRLGLGANAPLPASLTAVIDQTVRDASRKAIELGVTKDAEQAAGDASRRVVLDGFVDKVSAAREGIEIIQRSEDVQLILRKRAELLWAKKRALETAGFSAEDAMRILLAELGPRAR